MSTIKINELNPVTTLTDAETSQVTGGAEETVKRPVGAVCYGVSVLA